MTTVFGTSSQVVSTTTFAVLPGLTTTLTVPANSRVFISSDGGLAPASGSNGVTAVVDIALAIDNVVVVNAGLRRVTATNAVLTNGGSSVVAGVQNWSFSTSATPAAGSHTFAIAAALAPGGAASSFTPNAATVSGDSASVLQGQLTVIIVKQ